MPHSQKHLLGTIGLLFLAAWFVIVSAAYLQSQKTVLADARLQIQNALLYHRALHSYIEDTQKPELYRLKKEGHLYQAYFSPKVLSFTYIARSVQELLAQERAKAGLPHVQFKLASFNARNPINQADAFETELLRKLNNEEISEYQDLITDAGETYLYTALPVTPNRGSCMLCHGNPADAPAEMRMMYGDSRGFHEELGDIRAMISIRIPVSDALRNQRYETLIMALVSAAVMVIVFLVIAHFQRRLYAAQRLTIASNEKLAQLSITDTLTGLYNRNRFDSALRDAFSAAHRYRTPACLVMIDIDHFKRVNDRQGHLVGDALLKEFAQQLQQGIRDTDICARWGGEEFTVMLHHTELTGAIKLAENLLQRIRDTRFSHGNRLTASLGVTQLGDADTPESLVSRVDQALYQAKNKGRDRIEVVPAPA